MLRRSRAGWHASLQAEFSFPYASCAPALLQVPMLADLLLSLVPPSRLRRVDGGCL